MKATVLLILSLLSGQTLALNLTPTQEHIILTGYHVPFSNQTVQYVQDKHAKPLVSKTIQRSLTYKYSVWQEPADDWMWAVFWTLQAADIWSTHQGMKWDCVQEANPLLPSVPSIMEMTTLKGLVLLPAYEAIGYENITRAEMVFPILLTAGVVASNIDITNKASELCNRR